MAQEDKGSGGNLPVAGIVALVLFASGLWVQHQPIQSDRPAVELKQFKAPDIHQNVEARLWQDPLEAVKRAETAREKSPAPSSEDSAQRGRKHTPQSLRRWIGDKPGQQRLVMPVMIFGGPYAEDAEQRRRSRYAVLSGLLESGYAPVDGRSIGYVELKALNMLMPFEKWQKTAESHSPWDEVFVLWVTEESLGLAPVEQFQHLLALLLPAEKHKLGVAVIGPGSYGFANGLAGQLPTPPASRSALASAAPAPGSSLTLPMNGTEVRFMAPRLSVPLEALSVQDKQWEGPLTSLRLGPDDRQLANQLVDELVNHRIALPSAANPVCKDQVALVVEADTNYARSLERQFRERLKSCDTEFRPLVFHYFRGLDGKVAQDTEQAKKSGDSQPDKTRQDNSTAPQERAQGQGQFDFLRRIADEIRRSNDELEHQQQVKSEAAGLKPFPLRGSVRAVIVVGSDIHDKLAILHALRERLPQTLFATTDLDAGFLQKDQLPWTRNVIVASGFDLKLLPDLQASAPPLRDTYQTATYLAARKALADPARDAGLLQQIEAVSRQVKLFEVGNRGAVALTPAPLPGIPPANAGAAQGGFRHWGTLLTSAGLLLIFGLAISWCVRQLLTDLWQRKLSAIAGVAGGAALLGIWLWAAWRTSAIALQPGEEPLSWFDGVSAWPHVLIRFAAALLAVALFFYGIRKLRKGDQSIEQEFFGYLMKNPPAQNGAPSGGRWARFLETWFPGVHDRQQYETRQAFHLWLRYKSWTSGWRCCLRVAMGVAAIYWLTNLMSIELGTAASPMRGRQSWAFYFELVFWPYLFMLVLLVWTLDRVALCSLFLRRLYGSRDDPQLSDWSDDVEKKFCGYEVCSACEGAPGGCETDDEAAAQSYIDLRLSARMTRYVGGIIFYPFVLSCLLIAARARYFDNWILTPGFLAVISTILLLVAIGAFTLRHNAERIRGYTIEQLETLEVRMRAKDQQTNTRTTTEQVVLMKKIAIDMREGAFASFASQPIVRAILLPFGGAGLINLLDFVLI